MLTLMITEKWFQLAGLGRWLIHAIRQQDMPLFPHWRDGH